MKKEKILIIELDVIDDEYHLMRFGRIPDTEKLIIHLHDLISTSIDDGEPDGRLLFEIMLSVVETIKLERPNIAAQVRAAVIEKLKENKGGKS